MATQLPPTNAAVKKTAATGRIGQAPGGGAYLVAREAKASQTNAAISTIMGLRAPGQLGSGQLKRLNNTPRHEARLKRPPPPWPAEGDLGGLLLRLAAGLRSPTLQPPSF